MARSGGLLRPRRRLASCQHALTAALAAAKAFDEGGNRRVRRDRKARQPIAVQHAHKPATKTPNRDAGLGTHTVSSHQHNASINIRTEQHGVDRRRKSLPTGRKADELGKQCLAVARIGASGAGSRAVERVVTLPRESARCRGQNGPGRAPVARTCLRSASRPEVSSHSRRPGRW
jgi:hypothetical protein